MSFDFSTTGIELPSGWTLKKVSDIADINTDTIKAREQPEVIHYIDISSVSTGVYEMPICMLYSDAPSRAKRKLKDNNFIISTVRPNLKQYAMLERVGENWVASTGFCVISAKDKNTAWYLYSFITSDLFNEHLVRVADGGAYPAFNPKEIDSALIPWPCDKDLYSINEFAKIIDNKIELNRQTNQTLEQIAQAIFKSWFVDFEPTRAKIKAKESWLAAHQNVELSSPTCYAEQFDNQHNISLQEAMNRAAMAAISGAVQGCTNIAEGTKLGATKTESELNNLPSDTLQQLRTIAELFPDTLVESELGEIPAGWEVKSLSSVINVIGGGTPKRSEETYWDGEIPWFSIKDVPAPGDVFVVDTIEKISNIGLQKSSTKLLPIGTTIISARGTVGKVALVGTPMCMNQSCYGIQGIDGIGPYFNYFNLREAINTLQQNTHGAVFDTITTQTFESYSMAICIGEITQKFDDLIKPILEKIESNVYETLALSETRDTLLPKLLSGELSLADTDNQTMK